MAVLREHPSSGHVFLRVLIGAHVVWGGEPRPPAGGAWPDALLRCLFLTEGGRVRREPREARVGAILGREDGCWGSLWGSRGGQRARPHPCRSAGVRRSARSGPLASSAPSAVPARTGASAHPARAPVSAHQATRGPAARSACALRACTGQAAACRVPATPTTQSGRSRALWPGTGGGRGPRWELGTGGRAGAERWGWGAEKPGQAGLGLVGWVRVNGVLGSLSEHRNPSTCSLGK